MRKLVIGLLALALIGCEKEDKYILCQNPNFSTGNLEVINMQCLYFGNAVTGFIELRDKVTHKQFNYTMNVVGGKVVFNLSSANAIAIKKSDDAETASIIATGVAVGAANSSRR